VSPNNPSSSAMALKQPVILSTWLINPDQVTEAVLDPSASCRGTSSRDGARARIPDGDSPRSIMRVMAICLELTDLGVSGPTRPDTRRGNQTPCRSRQQFHCARPVEAKSLRRVQGPATRI
jgi:hypothetical protein